MDNKESKLSMNSTHNLESVICSQEKRSSDCKRTGFLWVSASYWLFPSVEFNKAQTTGKRIGSDRHRTVSVIYGEGVASITQEHFLGGERKHCCVNGIALKDSEPLFLAIQLQIRISQDSCQVQRLLNTVFQMEIYGL